ncbi:hypothetical protein C8Q77DRAFT_126851 [Trametes polyzona]|nr:hypothetical protein C8Q77DRAFT_126851 [Trametes polyzona]
MRGGERQRRNVHAESENVHTYLLYNLNRRRPPPRVSVPRACVRVQVRRPHPLHRSLPYIQPGRSSVAYSRACQNKTPPPPPLAFYHLLSSSSSHYLHLHVAPSPHLVLPAHAFLRPPPPPPPFSAISPFSARLYAVSSKLLYAKNAPKPARTQRIADYSPPTQISGGRRMLRSTSILSSHDRFGCLCHKPRPSCAPRIDPQSLAPDVVDMGGDI